MANRITTLVVDCADPERLAGFWCEVLGYEVLAAADADADSVEELDGSVEIGPPGQAASGGKGGIGNVPTLLFQPVPDPTPGKRRLHLDLNATDRDQEAELTRLLALGAIPTDVGQTGSESWRVLADPEGNEFCLLAGRVPPR